MKLSPQQWQHLTWLWYEPLSKISWSEPRIKETLATLRNSGLKLGILSNTFVHGSSLDKHLEQVGILDFFKVRVYSYEFPFRKPDARIFKVAAQRIGEAFENILYVGDRIDKDIRPAMRAGLSFFGLQDESPKFNGQGQQGLCLFFCPNLHIKVQEFSQRFQILLQAMNL